MLLKPNSKLWIRENILWASGFLEGEGCFSLSWTKPTNRKRAYPYLRVDATSTDLDVLERIQRMFGGYIYRLNRGPETRSKKPVWRWCVQKKEEVYAICIALFPFMGNRRRARILELVSAFRSPKYFLPPSVVKEGNNRFRNERGQYSSAP